MPIPNLDDHAKKKAKGLVRVFNTSDDKLFALVTRKFDAADGAEIDSEVTGVYIKEVDDALVSAQKTLNDLTAIRAQLIAAKPMPQVKAAK